ncbi:MAG: hypothetical protein V3G42_12700 [Oscillospiraceae bacterium]
MIRMQIEGEKVELELRGCDELILEELSIATIRMLKAMEMSEGNPIKENLAALVLSLLSESEQINTSG